MDLDDLLEDLLEDAGKAARRGARRVQAGAAGARRTVRRGVRAVGGVSAAALLAIAIALFATGNAVLQVIAAVVLVPAVVAGGAALTAHVLDRRDPRTVADRALRRGEALPATTQADLTQVPVDVADDWRRLLQARALVADLGRDGWIAGPSQLEIDGEVARLHRLLVAERRTTALGGRASPELRGQVGELADLLVALADDAVQLQVQAGAERSTAPATLTDARDHLRSLRAARREVADIDDQVRGRGQVGGTA
ncbi:hypothetical protein [Euzebya sp.]|uniref:hypothetical protein n=1 Tax=Euzebya sp. TaxID=1971409 RepID=UPI003516299B